MCTSEFIECHAFILTIQIIQLTCPGTKGPRGAPATDAEDGTEAGPSAAAAADDAAAARLAYLGSRDRRSS